MRKVALVLGLLAFVLNPGFACSPGDDGFTYGEQDMRDAVEGPWRVTIDKGQGPVSFTLRFAQATAPTTAQRREGGATLLRAAHACGTRTFVAGAAACIDLSDLPLAITFVDGDDAYREIAFTGHFQVMSLHFDQGNLELRFGDDWVNASLPRGETTASIRSTSILTNQGTPAIITMQRLSI
jgi:hypothetical protein